MKTFGKEHRTNQSSYSFKKRVELDWAHCLNLETALKNKPSTGIHRNKEEGKTQRSKEKEAMDVGKT